MEPEEQGQAKSAINTTIEKGKDLKEKADKTKKAIKIFMKLPTPVKIAIIAIPLVVIIIALLLGGAGYLLDILGWENIFTAKVSAMGSGTTYSTQIVKMTNGKWKFDMSDELKKKLTDAGVDISRNESR